MDREFFKALNKEPTMYGLKITGMIFGGIGSVIAIMKLGILWFVIGAVPGYIIGANISSYLHQGSLQIWLYWNTPLMRILGGKKLPPSYQRRFF